MFFARCVVYLGGLLPRHSQFSAKPRRLFDYCGCIEKVVAWHRAELKRLDPEFSAQQAASMYAAALEKAEEAGMSPLDPRYPNSDDFIRREGWEGDVKFFSPFESENFDPETVLEAYRATSGEDTRRLVDTVATMGKKAD